MNAFFGEIRAFPMSYAPEGWLLCNGATVTIQQYAVLYSLIGASFGGDGRTNFKLPDLRNQALVGVGSMPDGTTYEMGDKVGAPAVTLTLQQIPSHDHLLQTQASGSRATGPSASALPFAPRYTAPSGTVYTYLGFTPASTSPTLSSMAPSSIGAAGGNQSHDNLSPYLMMNYYIGAEGDLTYPSFD